MSPGGLSSRPSRSPRAGGGMAACDPDELRGLDAPPPADAAAETERRKSRCAGAERRVSGACSELAWRRGRCGGVVAARDDRCVPMQDRMRLWRGVADDNRRRAGPRRGERCAALRRRAARCMDARTDRPRREQLDPDRRGNAGNMRPRGGIGGRVVDEHPRRREQQQRREQTADERRTRRPQRPARASIPPAPLRSEVRDDREQVGHAAETVHANGRRQGGDRSSGWG